MTARKQSKIKIHKKMLFTEGDLINYLKTVKKFSKIEEEIRATLVYKRAYEKIHKVSTLVSFPYKENKETEIQNRPMLLAKDIGTFIRKYAEENSPIDSMLCDPKDSKISIVRPLQIKILGLGKYRNVTSEKFIDLLKKYKNYQENKISIIIILAGPHNIKLKTVVDWLKENKFPFPEVILVYSKNAKRDVEYYQLKPSSNGFYSLTIPIVELLRG